MKVVHLNKKIFSDYIYDRILKKSLNKIIADYEQRIKDAENNEMTNTPEVATSHYLQDSADSRFRKFIPIGRTTQESTTGVQLINITATSQSSQYGIDITVNNDKSITLNGTSTSSSNLYFRVAENLTLSPGNYTLSNGNNNAKANSFLFLDDGNTIPKANVSNVTLTEDTVIKPYIRMAPGTTMNKETIYPMIVKGTYTAETMPAYEPYTGGEASPNPSYPQSIKNTGDNGSVNEKVQNKNLFDESQLLDATNWVENNGVYSGTVGSLYNKYGNTKSFIFYKDFKENTRYTLSYYIKNLTEGSIYARMQIDYTDGTQNLVYKNSTDFEKVVITSPSNKTIKSITFGYSSAGNIALKEIQLEEGSTATDYVPHAEQNISFPLAQGQKLYEGSYPDDDEKVHHKRMQIVLDGSDDEVFDKRTDTNEIRYYLPINMKLNGKIIGNYFMQRQSTSDKNYVRAVATEPVNAIMFKSELLNTDEMTIAEWRQYLSEHNLILEIDLAEEQTEDFTEEQKQAWQEWKKARTYKNITHISSEDETPANVDITYVRDLETVINNLTTRVETIESEV